MATVFMRAGKSSTSVQLPPEYRRMAPMPLIGLAYRVEGTAGSECTAYPGRVGLDGHDEPSSGLEYTPPGAFAHKMLGEPGVTAKSVLPLGSVSASQVSPPF